MRVVKEGGSERGEGGGERGERENIQYIAHKETDGD